MREVFSKNRRVFLYLAFSNLLLAFGHRIWQGLFDNFAVERLGVGPDAVGWIQSAREVPGFLAIGVALLVLVFSEFRVMALSVILLGVGIVFTGYATSVPMLVAATIVMSIGFHFFGPSSNGVLMMSVDKRYAPRALGLLQSIGAFAGMIGMLAVLFLVDVVGYETLYLIVGGAVIAGGLVLLPFGGKMKGAMPARRRIRLRSRYWVFYALAFLMGSRRHIFTTFAGYLLVRDYATIVQVMLGLRLANAAINMVAYPFVGRLIDRFGERRILTCTFLGLIPVFLGYAYIGFVPILFALFIVDNLLFGCNMALTTYLQKIAVSPDELTSNLSTQETINHISAVVMPVAGGAIWVALGRQAPFLIGVGIAVASIVVVQFMRIHDPTGAVPGGSSGCLAP